MSIAKTIGGLPKPAQIAIAIGGALAIGYALWYAASALGLMESAPPGATTPTPVEPAAPTTTTASTQRTVVGTDSTGAPILGTGNEAIDKGASAVAARALSGARKLTS